MLLGAPAIWGRLIAGEPPYFFRPNANHPREGERASG